MHLPRIGRPADARNALPSGDRDHAGRMGEQKGQRERQPASRLSKRTSRKAPRAVGERERAQCAETERAVLGPNREGVHRELRLSQGRVTQEAKMPADTIQFGIIGTGMMGCEHIRNLKIVPGVRITAIADPDERSRGFGKLAAGANVEEYQDYRELLVRAPVDVVIATPNYTHYEVLEAVFRTRKHVLVEKPLCTEIEHCLRVMEATAQHPGLVWVGMEYRFIRPVARLVEEVRAGAVGQIRMIAMREHRFPFLPKVGDWNRFSRNTGGTLVEKCCHFFDLMNLITEQRPTLVYGSGGMDVNHVDERYQGETPDILDNAYVIVDFDRGARGLLDLCMFAENSTHEMEIAATGDRGKAEAFLPRHALVLTRRDRNEPSTTVFPLDPQARQSGAHHGSTLFEHLAFRDAIRSGGKPLVSVEDGALAVAVGSAAERSVKERRPVALHELGF
jgi:myo-inositol 2-dehydrogenase / D-chiro-inositol 1-dehydrogenase